MTTSHSIVKQPSVDHSHSDQVSSEHEVSASSVTTSHSIVKQPSVDHSHSDQVNSEHEVGVSSVTTSHSIVEQSDENQMSSRHKSDICIVTSENQLGRDQLNLRHETSSSCTNTDPGYTQ